MMRELRRVIETLVPAGYNVIPVTSDKRPVGLESYEELYERHQSIDEAREALRRASPKATGVAILGRINPWYPDRVLVLVDVDEPEKLPAEAREILERSPWHWLTGVRCPRDGSKHDIECRGDRCRHGDHEFNATEAKRGEAFAVLVPANCLTVREGTKKLLGGAVELRIRGYQLLPPSLHPSGIRYEWVRDGPFGVLPTGQSYVSPPLELSCEEWRRLLQLLGYFEAPKLTIERGVAGTRRCTRERILTDEQIDRILEAIKPVYVPGHRDHVLFGLASVLWRLCVAYESARKLVERLTQWALEQRLPDEDPKHNQHVVDWVYGADTDRRRWGRRGFVDALTEAYKAMGYSEGDARARALETLQHVLDILGIRRRVVLVPISVRGRISGKSSVMYIANHPSTGIVVLVKHLPNRREVERRCKELRDAICQGEEQPPECSEPEPCREDSEFYRKHREEILRGLIEYGYDYILPEWHISRAKAYVDAISGLTYYTVRLKHRRGRSLTFHYATISDIVERLRGLLSVPRGESFRWELQAILNAVARPRTTYVVAGVVLIDDRPKLVLRGPLAKHLRQLLQTSGDPRAFLELVQRWYSGDQRVWDAFALGLFQALSFLRKQKGLRNRWLVLAGEPGTGKSTIARIISTIIYGLPEEAGEWTAVRSPGALLSPARLARALQYTTLPVIFDEGGRLGLTRTDIVDTLKRAITGLTVYEVASPHRMVTTQFPAYSGAIITTQTIHVTDPGLADRLHIITFTARDRRSHHTEFLEWLDAHRADLAAFGAMYLRTVVEDWDQVKQYVLAEDPLQGARRLLEYVVAKLGAKPSYDEERADPEHVEDEVERTLAWIVESSTQQIRDAVSVLEAVERAIETGKLAPYITGGAGYANITAALARKLGITSLTNLAEKLREKGVNAEYRSTGRARVVRVPIDELKRLIVEYLGLDLE